MPQQFTNIDDRRYKRVEWGSAELPPCQAPLIDVTVQKCGAPGEFDTPTQAGPWADLCEKHEKLYAQKGHQVGYHRIRHA